MKRPVVSVNEAYAIMTPEESQRAIGAVDMNKDPLTMKTSSTTNLRKLE